MIHRPVAADGWRAAVGEALAEGWRFAGLHATREDATPALLTVLTRGSDALVLRCRAPERRVASLVDLVPAAAWDEREAHDLHGWSLPGHDPLRPLVDHDVPADAWTAPLVGRDAYRVAVGPIHAGVIESGHFRFAVVGERVLHIDVRLFHKHRGLEAAAEGHRHTEAIRYAQRACAADAVTNAVAYAQACEAATGLVAVPAVARARTLLLELERLYNHVNDISAICAGVGFAAGTMLFTALKERAQRLNAALTGHRFLFDAVQVGGSRLELDAQAVGAARAELDALRAEVARGRRELAFAGSLQERMVGIGRVSAGEVVMLGGVGPSARAAGVAIDARTASPQLAYDGFAPAAPTVPTGDVAARFELRGIELGATFELLDRLLDAPLAPAACVGGAAGDGLGVAVVESPRGQSLCVVELDGDRVGRLHLRTGSYANWPLVALAGRDALLPDFPLVNKSFELCYACVDR